MVQAANLGFPRIGARRELKAATEAFWKGELDRAGLEAVGRELRARHWRLQAEAGIAVIPSNDFSFYDHVLDMTCALGAVPPRFGEVGDEAGDEVGPDTSFAMARGAAGDPGDGDDQVVRHQLPLHRARSSRAARASGSASPKAVREFEEAKALGVHTRPVLVGPVTWLSLAKPRSAGLDPLALLPAILPVYAELLRRLAAAGADWVQIDEPVLALDLGEAQRAAFRSAYAALAGTGPALMLASYFGPLRDNLDLALGLPVAGLHVGPGARAGGARPHPRRAGARRAAVARGDRRAQRLARRPRGRARHGRAGGRGARPDRIEVAPSCSLLHVPIDLELENGPRSGAARVARLRPPEARRGRGAGARRARGARGGTGGARRQRSRGAVAARPRRASTTRASRRGRQRSAPAITRAQSPYAARGRPSRRGSGCRRCPPRPSARSRRPPRCARRARTSGAAPSTPGALRGVPRARDRAPASACRRRPGSTCWCTASSSATTWWSTSASSSTASPSPGPAGCRPTARAASSRR